MGLAPDATSAAIGDHTWARFVLDLQRALPDVQFRRATDVTGPLRVVKDAAEIAALRAAATWSTTSRRRCATRPFAGRTELDVHRELVERMLEGGHERANFAIVAAGPNAASPHHDPSDRVIVDGDVVLCDFGGTMHGYCSDITRMFVVGEADAEVREAYEVLVAAQEAGVQAATVGTPCEAVDAAARAVITDAGYGDYFVHRTGHGIGIEAHEDPYVVVGQRDAAGRRARVQRRAGHLRAGSLRAAARGHRGRDRRRPRAPQPRATRSRGRRLDRCSSTSRRLLAQWATGGLLFCWVTTRRREVGIGYGWLLRISYGVMAILSVVSGAGDDGDRRADPQRGDRARWRSPRAWRCSSRTCAGPRVCAGSRRRGERRSGAGRGDDAAGSIPTTITNRCRSSIPVLDLLAPVLGVVGLLGAASFVGGDYALSLARLVVGACSSVPCTDAMLLGHWYLVQPGLGRDPIKEMVKAVACALAASSSSST